jgi:hypothetical protein
VLFLQVLCGMKKLLGEVKRAFSSSPSSRGSRSHSNDRKLQDSPRSSSFVDHLALLADVVSRFKSFSEAPRLAQKYGMSWE